MNEHIKSAIVTFVSDFSYQFLIGLASLIQTHALTGEWTTSILVASLTSIGYTAFRHAVKVGWDTFLTPSEKTPPEA